MKNLLRYLFIISYFLLLTSGLTAQWVSNGTKLSFGKGDYHRPVISATKDGGAFITWVNSDSTSVGFYGNIFLNGLDAEGNILAGFPFHGITVTTIGSQWAPVVITSEDDKAILVWQGRNIPNGMLHLYAQKFSQAGTPLWNGGQPISISPTNNNQDQYPIVISDRHKGFYVTWNRFDSAITMGVTDIWLQHIDSTGNIANGWNPAGTAVANSSAYEYYPQLALSNDESAVYVIYSRGPIGGSALILKKFNASDGKQQVSNLLVASGIVVSPGPYLYLSINYDQFIFCDNQDNVVIFWSETRYTANGEVYMQQISPLGKIMLTGHGKYITGKNNGNGTGWMEASKDPDGNFLIACNDYSSAYNIDALKVGPDGSIIWQYLTTNGTSEFPKPITDGNKGMYVFYKNVSASPNLLQAIAINDRGTLYNGWKVMGADFGPIEQHTLFFAQDDFTIASAKPARGLVTWNRYDTDMFNIYACNLKNDGTNCDFDDSYVKELTNNNSVEVYPNPFTSVINIQQSVICNQHLTFTLYDITGKEILSKKLISPNSELRTPNLPNGLYFYNISDTQTSVKRGKLIKE